MQASQNTAQVFLGVNLKCNACHDSFVSKWKLKDAYALAGFFSPEPRLRLYRCDVAQDAYAEPGFLYPELSRVPPSESLADRRATAAAIFTDPRNGRLPRTIVNRLWQRLLGHGIVANPDDMDGKPWSPGLLDAARQRLRRARLRPQVRHPRHPDIARVSDARRRATRAKSRRAATCLPGPRFVDCRLNSSPTRSDRSPASGACISRAERSGGGGRGGPPMSDPSTVGAYGRDWRAASSDLTRALGRPIRDQIISARPGRRRPCRRWSSSNGEMLTRWLSRGARRMLGELPPDRLSLFNKAVAGRNASASTFDIGIASATRLWLIAEDYGSNAPERVEPLWAGAEFVDADGKATPLSSLTPLDAQGLRQAAGPATGNDGGVRVRPPVPTRLRHRRPRIHPLPRQHRARQPAERDRLDARTRRYDSSSSTPSPTWIACCRRRRSRPCRPPRRSRPSAKLSIVCSCTRSAARPRQPNAASP